MIEWNDYLRTVVHTKSAIDNITMSSREAQYPVLPIVKASILMLEDMIKFQGNHNVFVFPEIKHISRQFLLSKVIFNIFAGKIQMSYDPEKFKKGQILKYKGCTVKFERIDEEKGVTRIYIKFSDGMLYGVPIEYAPFFQISDSKKLSTYKRFCAVFSAVEAKAVLDNPDSSKNIFDVLENHKTHLNSSIIYVTNVKATREFLTSAKIGEKNITDIFYIAQANGDGILSNISAGQFSGNPAIILASDLYSAINIVNNGIMPQSAIVDVSQQGAVENQLDAFDELGQLGFPIVCITDTANSFELEPLKEREYNIWRWDKGSITGAVISNASSSSNTQVKNCFNHTIDYRSVEDENCSPAIISLYKIKNSIEDQHPKILSVYNKLFSIAFYYSRAIIPLDSIERANYKEALLNCENDLESAKRFTNPGLYDSILSAINYLKPLFTSKNKNKKYESIVDIISHKKYYSVCIVIPEKYQRDKIEQYWKRTVTSCEISIMYPLEYHEMSDAHFDLVIVSGWLGNRIMRKLIFGYSAPNYIVLTYPCEERWKKSHTKAWRNTLEDSSNSEVVKNAFSKTERPISSKPFEYSHKTEYTVPVVDELDEIEYVIQRNRFKQYSSGTKSNEAVDAYPVSFVGGFMAFYRTGHQVLTVTDIIANDGEKIIQKKPDDIHIGDFIVIRESGHDIIRELADSILERSGKAELRTLSTKWKESLQIETLFSTYEEIYEKLCSCGCKRDYSVVRNWITNDDLIQPSSKDDILCIAEATGDDVLKEKIENIYEAGIIVRNTHKQAGRILSKRLKNKIGEHIRKLEKIDAYNVWDPITIPLEDIGQVIILKVIDVSDIISVDISNTNRLISE